MYLKQKVPVRLTVHSEKDTHTDTQKDVECNFDIFIKIIKVSHSLTKICS